MALNKGTFIQINYAGRLKDGMLFDTTSKEEAQKESRVNPRMQYGPVTICVGEGQLVKGLDADLIGKEIGKEYTIDLNADMAFGKKDAKMIRMLPLAEFRKHKMDPQPGMPVTIDNHQARVLRVSGGRVLVDFNNPLAGQDVSYTYTVVKEVTDAKEQIQSYLAMTMGLPVTDITVTGASALVKIPFEMPANLAVEITKKLSELTSVSDIKFEKVAPKENTA